MKVESIQIKNFKAISEQNIDCHGRNVYALGPNATGKSSFLDAIFKTLTGEDLPSKLVKDGEQKGKVKIDLGQYIVEADFNAKKEKMQLTVSNSEGAIYKTPRTMLDELVGVIDFDLNGFFHLSPKKKVEFIKELVGIDFSDMDAEYKRLFEERTYVNRQVKELSAVVDAMRWDATKTEKIDLSAVQAQLEQAQKHNQQRADVAKRNQEREEQNTKLKERNAALLLEIEQNNTIIGDNDGKNYLANRWLLDTPEADISAIKFHFDNALEHNAAVDNTIRANAELNKLKAAEVQQATLNAQLQGIEAAKKEAIAEAKLPVPGLTFDDEQLYLNGLPFEPNQINTAHLIIAGLQIQLAMVKDVRIARFDGSLLDNKSLKEVEAWAKENDLQLFVEMVDRDGEGMQIVLSEEVREEVAA